MTEPADLRSALAEALAKTPPDARRRPVLEAMSDAHRRNQDRRTAVLKHEDLRDRLRKELGYERATDWNGYVPPRIINPGEPELCKKTVLGKDGSVSFRYNQLGRYSLGEQENDSPRRRILVEISEEAWRRGQAGGPAAPPAGSGSPH